MTQNKKSVLSFLATSAIFLIALVTWLMAGSSSPSAESLALQLAEAPASQFADNIKTYKTKSADEVAILAALKRLQSAYEGAGAETAKPLLLPNFEFTYKLSADRVATDTAQAYLASRAWWKSNSSRNELLYAIKGIDFVGKEKTKALVTVFATYKTKYFGPRFLEIYAFEKRDGKWLLRKQTVFPVAPTAAEDFGVQIFVTDARYGSASFGEAFGAATAASGPDYLIDEFRRTEIKDTAPEDEVFRTVLFVFRETPPIGTEIKTEHQWKRGTKEFQPSVYKYVVEAPLPFYVIENKTASGGQGDGTLTWRVRIGDKLLAEKTVKLQKLSNPPGEKMDNGAYLPLDAKISPPATDVPRKYAGFSGLWEGEWNGDLASAIAIEEVTASGDVVLAFGLEDDLRDWGAKEEGGWYVPRRWQRIEAKFSADGKLPVGGNPKEQVILELLPNGKLHGEFTGEDGKLWEADFTK